MDYYSHCRVEGLELASINLVGSSNGLALITSFNGNLLLASTSTTLNIGTSSTGSNAEFLTDSEVAATSIDDAVEGAESVGADAVLGGNGVTEIASDDIDLLGAASSTSVLVASVVASAVVVVAAVVASSTSSTGLDLEVDTIVEGSVLGNGDENGLMVHRRIDLKGH